VTVAAAAAVSACGTGQVNQTAYMAPAVAGVNQTFSVNAPDDSSAGSISVRDMLVTYDGAEGYKAGGNAPLQLGIFNDTAATLKVTITAPTAAKSVTFRAGAPVEDPEPTPTAAAEPTASASAKPRASASAAPSEEPKPPAGPATFTIPSGDFLMLTPRAGKFLVLQGLTKELKPGGTVDGVTFQFQLDGGLQVEQQPVSPAPEASPVPSSCVFSGGAAICRAPLGTPHEALPRTVPTGGGEHE